VAFGIVLVVVAGAVATFGIYTWGWRDDEDTGSASRARAYADAVAASCDPEPCRVRSLDHISGDDWKVVLRNPTSGSVGCALIQTNRFAERASGDFAGASRMECPETRSGKTTPEAAPPGPGWWSEDVAAQKIEHSRWASDNELDQAIFDCIGQGASRADGSTGVSPARMSTAGRISTRMDALRSSRPDATASASCQVELPGARR
jgi:hypothetical protein